MTADVLGRDFTQAGNSALRDRRLSRRAKGLLAELLSHRDGFGISIQSLVAAGPEGRDAIRAALAELERHGYLHRSQGRDERGRLGDVVYEVTDMPKDDEPAVPPQSRRSEPAPEKPTSAEPAPVNPHHKKTIPFQGDQLEEHHLSLPSVPKQRATSEREMDAAPDTTTTTTPTAAAAAPLPGVDAYTAQLADAAATARVPAPRGTGTDSQQQEQQQPQAASQPPAVTGTAPSAADRIVDAYTAILGRPVLSGTRGKLHDQAAEALAAGYPEAWLTDRARELAAHGWTDLAKHVEKSTVPLPGATPSAASSGRPPWCGECGGGHGAAAQFNMRFRRRDDGTPCHCHPDVALPRPSTTDQRVQAALDHGRQMQAEYDAAQARPRGWEQYPHCGHPDCDEITRYREVDNGNGRSPVPCSGCHPSMQF